MLSIEQEKLGASFKKMCERFLSNTTAGVFAMIVAQILWDDYFDRENPQPMDERIGNEASLARMTALGAVEAVCYQLARAAGEVDSLGLPPPKVERKSE